MTPFELGVNYWPRRKAMYWWSDFDKGEVEEEFSVIREIGMTKVRVFLLWDHWQPTPDSVSMDCLRNLETVADIAAARGLSLDVTFFTGHMSGPNWSPGWLLDPNGLRWQQLVSGDEVVDSGYRNMFSDPVALDAERLLLKTVVGALREHPAIWLWNLGNEPDLFAHPPTDAQGAAWVREMTALIKSIDPVHPVTCGLHIASVLQNNGLRVDQVYRETDVAVMHAYPMYIHWARDPLDPDFVPFTAALTTALSGKPTLFEEFGGCTVAAGEPSQIWAWTAYGQPRTQFMASEDDFAAYIEQILPRLQASGSTGALLWCYADYIAELWDKPPCSESRHERFFGLVRPDGTLKPHAKVIQKFAQTQPQVLIPTRRLELGMSTDEFYQDPAGHSERLYHQWIDGLR